ncbi:MAG: VWA domain-containing protein [Gammaproteobacteria bacterium]
MLQAAVVLGVIGLLAGPGLQTTKLQPGANHVAVLVDTSGSMAFPDTLADGAPSRISAARALAGGVLSETLTPLAEVATFGFDTSAARVDAVTDLATGNADTHLIAATDAVLSSFKGMPLAAVVVLSDGADNDDLSAVDTAALASYGVPVHTIGFGPATLPGEAQLTDVQLAAEAPPASRVTARVVIEHASAGEAVLKVRDMGRLIAADKVVLPAESPTVRTEISFDAGEAGIRELTFELEPPAGDRLAENNTLDRLLTVSERRRRILYLEGEPRWEYKFLRRAVAGDDVLELVSWLRTTDRKTYRQGVSGETELEGGFPTTRAELYGYDVVVLGSLDATTLNDEQHAWLEAFVSERGGSLLALAGRAALDDGRWDVQPLAAALPVHLARSDTPRYQPIKARARPTALGERSPFTQLYDAEGGDGWATLPELGDLQRLGELKPAATTLLEVVVGEEVYPLLVTQPYGLGNTAVLATASTWRWQMRTPPEDPRHAIFWRQLLRQLAESAQQRRSVNLALDGDGIVIRARLKDAEYRPLENVSCGPQHLRGGPDPGSGARIAGGPLRAGNRRRLSGRRDPRRARRRARNRDALRPHRRREPRVFPPHPQRGPAAAGLRGDRRPLSRARRPRRARGAAQLRRHRDPHRGGAAPVAPARLLSGAGAPEAR